MKKTMLVVAVIGILSLIGCGGEGKSTPVTTVSNECAEGLGYSTIKIGDQIWFDRALGAQVGGVGTYYTVEESGDVCPCGFGLPTVTDVWDKLGESSGLKFPSGVHNYWLKEDSRYEYSYFGTEDSEVRETSQYTAGGFDGFEIPLDVAVRCIDPSTSIAD